MNDEIVPQEPEVKPDALEILREIIKDVRGQVGSLNHRADELDELRKAIELQQAADAEEREHFITALRQITALGCAVAREGRCVGRYCASCVALAALRDARVTP